MAQISINGSTYGLRFDLGALEVAESEFGDLKAVFDNLRGGQNRLSTVKRLFVIMANCERGYRGEAEDVTEDALRHAPLAALSTLGEALTEAFKESMRMETVGGGEADDEVHDGFLEELERKNAETGD